MTLSELTQPTEPSGAKSQEVALRDYAGEQALRLPTVLVAQEVRCASLPLAPGAVVCVKWQ